MNDISRKKRRIGAAVLALALGTVACREDGVTGSTDTDALPGTTPALAVAGASKLGPDVGGLPTSGAAWDRVRSVAAGSWSAPDLCAKENKAAMQALAGALVYARTGDASYKTKVVNAINRAVGTQRDNCSSAALALGRQLGAWVMAADYVGYRDASFVKWLTQIRARNIGGHSRWFSLRVTAGNSSNNWGDLGSRFSHRGRPLPGRCLVAGAGLGHLQRIWRWLLDGIQADLRLPGRLELRPLPGHRGPSLRQSRPQWCPGRGCVALG